MALRVSEPTVRETTLTPDTASAAPLSPAAASKTSRVSTDANIYEAAQGAGLNLRPSVVQPTAAAFGSVSPAAMDSLAVALGRVDPSSLTVNPDGSTSIAADHLDLWIGGAHLVSDDPVILTAVNTSAGERLYIDGENVRIQQGVRSWHAVGNVHLEVSHATGTALPAFDVTAHRLDFNNGADTAWWATGPRLHIAPTAGDGLEISGTLAGAFQAQSGESHVSGAARDSTTPLGLNVLVMPDGTFRARADAGTLAWSRAGDAITIRDGASINVDGSQPNRVQLGASAGSYDASFADGTTVAASQGTVQIIADENTGVASVTAMAGSTRVANPQWGNATLSEGVTVTALAQGDRFQATALMGRAQFVLNDGRTLDVTNGRFDATRNGTSDNLLIGGDSATYVDAERGRLEVRDGATIQYGAQGERAQLGVTGGSLRWLPNNGRELTLTNGEAWAMENGDVTHRHVQGDSAEWRDSEGGTGTFTGGLRVHMINNADGSVDLDAALGTGDIRLSNGNQLSLSAASAQLHMAADGISTSAVVTAGQGSWRDAGGRTLSGTGLRVEANEAPGAQQSTLHVDDGALKDPGVGTVVLTQANVLVSRDAQGSEAVQLDAGALAFRSHDPSDRSTQLNLVDTRLRYAHGNDESTRLQFESITSGRYVIGEGAARQEILIEPLAGINEPVALDLFVDQRAGITRGRLDVPAGVELVRQGETLRLANAHGTLLQTPDRSDVHLDFANGQITATGAAGVVSGFTLDASSVDHATQVQLGIGAMALERFGPVVGGNLEIVNVVGNASSVENAATGVKRTEAHVETGNMLGNIHGVRVTAINPENGRVFRFDVATTETPTVAGDYALQLNSVLEIVDGSEVLLAGRDDDVVWNAMLGGQRVALDVHNDPATGQSSIRVDALNANLRGQFDGYRIAFDSDSVRASSSPEGLLIENVTNAHVTIHAPGGDNLRVDVAEIQRQVLSAARIDTADLSGTALLMRPADASGRIHASLVFNVSGLPISVDLDQLHELEVLAAAGSDQAIVRIGDPSGKGGKTTVQLGSLRMVGEQVGLWLQHRQLNPHVVLSSDESGTLSMLSTDGERIFPGVRIDTARDQIHLGYVGDPKAKLSGHLVATLKMPYGAKDVTTYMLRGDDALGRANVGFALKAGVGTRRGDRTHELGGFAALDGSSSLDANFIGDRTSLEIDGKSHGLGAGLRLPTFASTGLRYATSTDERQHEVVVGAGADVLDAARSNEPGQSVVGFAHYELSRRQFDGTRGIALGVLGGDTGSAIHVGWRRTWSAPRAAVPTESVSKPKAEDADEILGARAKAPPPMASPSESRSALASRDVDPAMEAQRLATRLMADSSVAAERKLRQHLEARASDPEAMERQAVMAATVLAQQATRRASAGSSADLPLDWALVKQARSALRDLLTGPQRTRAVQAMARVGGLHVLDARELKGTHETLALEDAQAMLRGQSDGRVWSHLGSRVVGEGRKETGHLVAALGRAGLSPKQVTLLVSHLELGAVEQVLKGSGTKTGASDASHALGGPDQRAVLLSYAREPRTRWQALVREAGPKSLLALQYDIADRLHTLKYEGRVAVRLPPNVAAAAASPAGAQQVLGELHLLAQELEKQRASGQALPPVVMLAPGKSPPWREITTDEAAPDDAEVRGSLPLWRAQLARAGIALEGELSRDWIERYPDMRRGLVGVVDFLLERPEMVSSHGISAVRIDSHTKVHSYALRASADAEPTSASLLEIDRYSVREGYGRLATDDAEQRGFSQREVNKVAKAIWTQDVSAFKVGTTSHGRSTDFNVGYSRDGFFAGVRQSRDDGTGAFVGVSKSTPLDPKTALKAEVGLAPGMAQADPSAAMATAYVGVDRRFGSTRTGSSVAFLGFGFRSIADVGRLGTLVGARGRYEGGLADAQYFVGNGFASAQLELGPDELGVGLIARYDTVNQAYLGGRFGKAKAMASVTGLAFQWGQGHTFIASLMPPFFVIEPAPPEYREHGYLGPLTRLGTSDARNANEMAVNAAFYGVLAQERGLQPDQQEVAAWIDKYALRAELDVLVQRRATATTAADKEAAQREINAWFEDLAATIMIDSYVSMESRAGKMAAPRPDEKVVAERVSGAIAAWRQQNGGSEPDGSTRSRLEKLVRFQQLRADNLDAFAATFFQGRKPQMDALILWARTDMLLGSGSTYPQWQEIHAGLAPLSESELSRGSVTQRLRTHHEGLRKAQEPVDALSRQVAAIRSRLGATAAPEVSKALGELEGQLAALDGGLQDLVERAAALGPRVAKDDLGAIEKERAALVADTRHLLEGVSLGDSRIELLCGELAQALGAEATRPLLDALRALESSPRVLALLPLHPSRLGQANRDPSKS